MESVEASVMPKHGSLCMTLSPDLFDVDPVSNDLIIHIAGGSIRVPLMGLQPDQTKHIRIIVEMALAQPR